MNEPRPAMIFELVATTRGRRRGDRRLAALWTVRSIIICPSIDVKVAENLEIELKRLAAPPTLASTKASERPPEEIVHWIAHHQPGVELCEIPLGELIVVEWPGGRGIVIETRRATWTIACDSAWEAGREFRLLQGETDRFLRDAKVPRRGLPRGLIGLVVGVAIAAIPFVRDLGGLVEAMPGATNPDAVRDFFIDLQAPPLIPWLYRGALLVGGLIALVSAWRMIYNQRSDALVLLDSSTPMSIQYVPKDKKL